ncbi:MAG TPA: Ig-like domain-containing protein [Rudaea sp.]|nr:Ig-like domain-containing protein [Rudaea sp.]
MSNDANSAGIFNGYISNNWSGYQVENTAQYTESGWTIPRVVWSRDCSPNPKWPSFLHAYSSRNPSLVGQPVTFTALVMGMNPTGTVTFTSKPDGPNNADEITTLCDSVPLVDSIATCTVSDFAANSSNVSVATYSGDANSEPADNGIGPIFGFATRTFVPASCPHSPGSISDKAGDGPEMTG